MPAREALRKSAEHKLIEAYKQALGPSPRRWAQWVFAVDTRSGMTPDLWDKNLGVLIEAKGSAERAAVRMAIGQLLDYRHALAGFIAGATQPKGDPLRSSPLLAVLLPRRPDADVLSLLEAVKIARIWKEGRTFEDNAAGLFTQSGTPIRRGFRASRWSGLLPVLGTPTLRTLWQYAAEPQLRGRQQPSAAQIPARPTWGLSGISCVAGSPVWAT